MRGSLLWRRLVVGAAGVTIVLGAALATAAPVQAQQPENAQVAFFDLCDATWVLFTSDLAIQWSVRVDGDTFWPQAGDQQPAPGEVVFVRVPNDADLIRVNYQGSTSDWPKDHTWSDPGGECDVVPEVTFSQPTCDVATGEIGIPGFGVDWLIDGARVEPGSTNAVHPGRYVVEVLGLYLLEFLLDDREGEVLLAARTWVIDIQAPECPVDSGAGGRGEDSGGGGELAATGGPTGLLAGAAAVLLLLGAALYAAGRRRAAHLT
jgi:hypothetical protein